MAWVHSANSVTPAPVTGHQAMADRLLQIAVSNVVTALAINAAGTGYSVGNELEIAGGTNYVKATAIVTSIGGGGAVTGVRIGNAGAYTANPTTTGNSVTGGGGSGCTLNLTMGTNGWTVLRAVNVGGTAQSATIGAGGTGYSVGNVLTVSGGTALTSAQFTVTAVSGGAVTAVRLSRPGHYTSTPSNAAATTGAGTGCTLNITYGGTGEREIIVQGTGGGSDAIYIGWRTYSDTPSGARNWEMAAFKGFSGVTQPTDTGGIIWDNQPGISPGRFSAATNLGAYVPLTSSTIDYYVSCNSFRIHCWMKVGSSWPNCSAGFLDRFGTSGEYPYPVYVAGTTSDWDSLATNSQINNSSFADPIKTNVGACAHVNTPGGVWSAVWSSTWDGATRSGFNSVSTPTGSFVYPSGYDLGRNLSATGNNWISDPGSLETRFSGGSIPNSGNPGTQIHKWNRTTNSPADTVVLTPCVVVSPLHGPLGEISNTVWFDAQGGIVAGDTLTVGSSVYRVFQSHLRADTWAMYGVKEA